MGDHEEEAPPQYEDEEMPGEWVSCWKCDGYGKLDGCPEDVCVCVDPPCIELRCDTCAGIGGWTREKAHD